MCPECQPKQKATVRALMDTLEIFWHCGQIIPLEDRKKLADLVGELAIAPDRGRVRNEIADLLMEHEVQIIFRSKHKEMSYQPLGQMPEVRGESNGTIDKD